MKRTSTSNITEQHNIKPDKGDSIIPRGKIHHREFMIRGACSQGALQCLRAFKCSSLSAFNSTDPRLLRHLALLGVSALDTVLSSPILGRLMLVALRRSALLALVTIWALFSARNKTSRNYCLICQFWFGAASLLGRLTLFFSYYSL
jgi:hypothetical protein